MAKKTSRSKPTGKEKSEQLRLFGRLEEKNDEETDVVLLCKHFAEGRSLMLGLGEEGWRDGIVDCLVKASMEIKRLRRE